MILWLPLLLLVSVLSEDVNLDSSQTQATEIEASTTNSGPNSRRKQEKFEVGSEVDAYWPPDRYGRTKLQNILWPGVIHARDDDKKMYSIKFSDGEESSVVPFDWAFTRLACEDEVETCVTMARRGDCQKNVDYMYEYCRSSCQVCTNPEEEPKEQITDMDFKEFKKKIMDLRFGPKFELSERNPLEAKVILEKMLADGEENKEKLAFIYNNLGTIHLFGGNEESDVPKDTDVAFDYFQKSAGLGDPDGQFYVGFIHSLRDNHQMSLLYYYFAANGGSAMASLTLAFKHQYGMGVPKSCESAIEYHSSVAEQVIMNPNSAHQEATRLDSSSGQHHDLSKMDATEVQNLVQYQEIAANGGNVEAQVTLGMIHQQGHPGIPVNYEEALRRFAEAAGQGNGMAEAFLAQMYINGHGVKSDNQTAFKHMQSSANKGTPEGLQGLGQMYQQGIGTDPDTAKAMKYYQKAADKGNSDAQFHLGMMYFSGLGTARDYANALKFFSKAAVQGHLHAIYYVGWMHRNGLATAKSCRMAIQLFQIVSHRSAVSDVSNLAKKMYNEELFEEAFGYYSLAAEMGFEIAQYNAGFMASRTEGVPDDDEVRMKQAFRYYGYSSDQGNANSQRIIGDFYYYLWPPVNATTSVNETHVESSAHYQEAVYYYDLAAKNLQRPNAHAMWNLGYMHHHGLGRPRDLQLAKRFYDQSRMTSDVAYAPTMLSLLHLYVEMGWEYYLQPFFQRTFDSFSDPGTNDVGIPLVKPWYFELENIVLVVCSVLLLICVIAGQFRLGHIN